MRAVAARFRCSENMGFRVDRASATCRGAGDRRPVAFVHDMDLEGARRAGRSTWPTAARLLRGRLHGGAGSGIADSDGFNALCRQTAGLPWREIALLPRASPATCSRPARPLTQDYMRPRSPATPALARGLVAAVRRALRPGRGRSTTGPPSGRIAGDRGRARSRRQPRRRPHHPALPQHRRVDRCGRISSSLGPTARRESEIAIKLDSEAGGRACRRRDRSARSSSTARASKACTLRFGPVARGGLRWSDRHLDFRTEVLGLAKAQQAEERGDRAGRRQGRIRAEAVARAAATATAVAAEARAAYEILHRPASRHHRQSRRRPRSIPPPSVVRRDGDDPYLVVAADKGTATFSDTANAIAGGAASGSATPSPAAARTATTTRRWGSPRAAPGWRWSAISARWTSTSRPTPVHRGRRRRHVRRRVRQRHAALAGDQAGRRLRPSRHLHRSGPGSGGRARPSASGMFDLPRVEPGRTTTAR